MKIDLYEINVNIKKGGVPEERFKPPYDTVVKKDVLHMARSSRVSPAVRTADERTVERMLRNKSTRRKLFALIEKWRKGELRDPAQEMLVFCAIIPLSRESTILKEKKR